MNRRAPQRRPTGWKPPRRKGELLRAVLAGVGVVVINVGLILGLHELDSPGSTSPAPPVTTPATGSTPTGSTPPGSFPPVSIPPVSIPPVSTPPVSAPPASGP